jgi:hypothetical protein
MRIVLMIALATTQSAFAAIPDVFAYKALAREDLRLSTIGYRLAAANMPFCSRKSRNPGWVLHDKAQYPDADMAQAAFGFRAAVAVSAVVPGGTAEALGIKAGDGLSAINGIELSKLQFAPKDLASARLEKIHTILDDALGSSGTAEIALVTSEGQKRITLAPPAMCASRFWLDTKSGLDAGADGISVRVTEDLLAFTAHDDGQLAAIVAHEMAHNLLGHRQRVSGGGKGRGQILATEIEADRLSVWLMANAGYDTAAALRFAERYGRKTDLGIFSDGTHLRWKNRQRVMRQEIALIAQAETSSGLRAPPLLMALEMVK